MIFSVLGAALPLSQFVPWLIANGVDLPLFFDQLLVNPISRFFVLDVVISALVLITLIMVESNRLAIKKGWLAIVATLCVGVSLGLPLFLYLRQLTLDEQQQAS
ncbi:MAG: DUF2834 domain-containing protein [Gammaproteobacteria bacterium]|nr:DUF2834 domain-containing protein [Gammaproteobacteria bacterium]